MYSFTEMNEKKYKYRKSKSNNGVIFHIIQPYPYTLCMSSKSPCTSNSDVGDIKKKLVLGYKIYYY